MALVFQVEAYDPAAVVTATASATSICASSTRTAARVYRRTENNVAYCALPAANQVQHLRLCRERRRVAGGEPIRFGRRYTLQRHGQRRGWSLAHVEMRSRWSVEQPPEPQTTKPQGTQRGTKKGLATVHLRTLRAAFAPLWQLRGGAFQPPSAQIGAGVE